MLIGQPAEFPRGCVFDFQVSHHFHKLGPTWIMVALYVLPECFFDFLSLDFVLMHLPDNTVIDFIHHPMVQVDEAGVLLLFLSLEQSNLVRYAWNLIVCLQPSESWVSFHEVDDVHFITDAFTDSATFTWICTFPERFILRLPGVNFPWISSAHMFHSFSLCSF